MKELLLVVSLLGLVWAGNYLYKQGLRDGEQRYKQSHRMYMALKSAYSFGWYDGHYGHPNDWDGNDQ